MHCTKSGITIKQMRSWLTQTTSANSKSLLLVQVLQVHLPLQRLPNWVIKLMHLHSTIHRVARTRLRHKVELTQQRITKAMATALIACSKTPLRVATSVHVKRTCIVWLKCQSTSSTKWLRRVFHSLANTADCSTIAALVVHK